jgi:hypothetical protein
MHIVDERPPQGGSSLLEDFNGCVDGNLLILIQGFPPGSELVGAFNFPDQGLPSNANNGYNVSIIQCLRLQVNAPAR